MGVDLISLLGLGALPVFAGAGIYALWRGIYEVSPK